MSDEKIKNTNSEDEYKEIFSESEHVPDEAVEIMQDEQTDSSLVQVEILPVVEVKTIVEDVVHSDDFKDECSLDDKKSDDVEVITDVAEIKADESAGFASNKDAEISSILKKSGSILDKICEDKKVHIRSQKALVGEEKLLEKIKTAPAPRGFCNAIKATIERGENALIAEVKKASPSKGVIRSDFSPAKISTDYEEGGASCISVLTDVPYFQGSDEYLKIVRHTSRLPVLRKDFILDVYQVVESRAVGADCILLIMSILTLEQAILLEQKAIVFGMDVLIEVHNESELEKALKLKSDLIGINNRDLKTFEVDLSVTERLAPMIPQNKIVVCESGIYGFADIVRMNNAGVKAFLVGDALMSQDDVKLATQALLGNIV